MFSSRRIDKKGRGMFGSLDLDLEGELDKEGR